MLESRRESRKAVGFSLRAFVRACAMSSVIVLGIAFAMPGHANDWWLVGGWHMVGHDIFDTRSQPFEFRIGPRNAARLWPKWELTTAGDVSATPAVGTESVGGDDKADDGWRSEQRDDRFGRRTHRRGVVFFPDWGGKLWKVDAETGEVLWSRSIPDYNGIPGSISRTSPVLAHGMVYVADLNGNLMAVDATTGDLRWKTELDPNLGAIVTASPIILGNHLYINVSSNRDVVATHDARLHLLHVQGQHAQAECAHGANHLAVLRPPGQQWPALAASPEGPSSILRPLTWNMASCTQPPVSSIRSQPRLRRVSRRPVAGARHVFQRVRTLTR